MMISNYSQSIVPFSWEFIGATLFALTCIIVSKFYNGPHTKNSFHVKLPYYFLNFIAGSAKKPLLFFIFFYSIYLLFVVTNLYYPLISNESFFKSFAFFIECSTIFYWLICSFRLGQSLLLAWLLRLGHSMAYILFNIVGNSFQLALLLALFIVIVPEIGLTGAYVEIADKITQVLLIGTLGWIFIQVISGLEEMLIKHITQHTVLSITDRKIITQVRILKNTILIISIFIIVAAMLMVFDSVRSLGTGLLTTAGIIGAVGAFASQKSLSSMFSGLKIAFTQPIRIGDNVVIENESGQVEEMTLSYIVIKLWDLRRLILPTEYLATKSILNLTRNSSELLGTIFFYVDYTVPVDSIRDKFNEILKGSILWDKKASSFQVTDLKEQSIELRALVSAKNSADLWNLRCELREQLLKFIVEHFPNALPRTRQSVQPS